jgi:hypothetical protein
VFTPSVRACLLLCVVATAVVTPTVAAEPPGATKPAPKETEAAFPALPTVAADAPKLRKVQLEQVKEGLAYIERSKELVRSGTWVVSDFRRYADVLTDTCRVAAELEDKPAKRVAWFEVRLRQMKDVEELIDRAVRAGGAAPQELNLVRFQRLQAEVDLLKLKAEVEKPAGK